MIYESSYWKSDLLKLATRLQLRLIQTRWGKKNLYTLEKEIFIGFYSIRKLIESKKVSSSIKNKSYEIKKFVRNNNVESLETNVKDFNYDFGKI